MCHDAAMRDAAKYFAVNARILMTELSASAEVVCCVMITQLHNGLADRGIWPNRIQLKNIDMTAS
jgi:hypothetical protein